MKALQILITAATLSLTPLGIVLAHGDKPQAKKAAAVVKEQKPFGIAGDAESVTRTVEIRMLDTMRYSPDRVEVKQGETIRFVHKNYGKIMHEFVIGTKKDLDEHSAFMQKFPKMQHEEPYMAHVAPGTTGQVVWTFNRAGEFDFACLIPGHYQAGMIGKIKVSE